MAVPSHEKNIAQRAFFKIIFFLATTGHIFLFVSHILFPIFLAGSK